MSLKNKGKLDGIAESLNLKELILQGSKKRG